MDDLLRRNRKYKAFWVTFLAGTALAVLNKLTPDYTYFVGTVYGIYMVGNVGVRMADNMGKDNV